MSDSQICRCFFLQISWGAWQIVQLQIMYNRQYKFRKIEETIYDSSLQAFYHNVVLLKIFNLTTAHCLSEKYRKYLKLLTNSVIQTYYSLQKSSCRLEYRTFQCWLFGHVVYFWDFVFRLFVCFPYLGSRSLGKLDTSSTGDFQIFNFCWRRYWRSNG